VVEKVEPVENFDFQVKHIGDMSNQMEQIEQLVGWYLRA
jgi:hypothetical protein